MEKKGNISPPRWPLRFFRWFCDPDFAEDIEGDLFERFDKRTNENKSARWLFTMDVLRLFRPGIIRNFEGTQKLNYYGMFKNYFKITWRNLFRQKLYSAINIGGLAIGITVFILISIYVQHERSYDLHYENAENIYNIYQRQKTNFSLGTDLYAVTPPALPSTLIEEYPEVINATTLDIYNTLIQKEDDGYVEDVLFADEHYFEVFKHTFLKGDPATALSDKTGAVITESFAKKVFGDEDPIGQKITFWSRGEAYITGVIEDLPSNTTLQFSGILSLKNSKYYLEELAKTAWNGNSHYTFFTLDEKTNVADFQTKIQQILKDHWAHTNIPSEYLVSRLQDLHLRSNVNEDIGIKGNAQQMNIFSIIAIVVLVLASVNYMNLAIARSVKRAKEVGLRKAIGAEKRQLVTQFLIESVFLALLSFILSFMLLQATAPIFGKLVERQLDIFMIYELNLIPVILGVVVFVGIISGSYPALFMSSLKPTQTLKGKIQMSGSGSRIQKTLIIFQYTISIVMITLSMVVFFQMRFISQKQLGFQKEQIITYKIKSGVSASKIEDQFASNTLTSNYTFSSSLPTNIGSSTFLKNDRTGGNIYRLYVDRHFLDIYEIELAAGRFLEEYDSEEDLNYILNETAAKALGWTPEEAVGQEFINEGGERKTIIGVVKDFHMHSMHMPIAPLMMGIREYRPYLSIRVNPENISETIEYMEEVIGPYTSYPFVFQFVDDNFNELYQEDQRQAEIFGFFTILAILIASMGLFGLAAFNVSQRTKEIGIRKVLGATMKDIVISFTQNFMHLVTIGFIVAIPAAWYLSTNWLENFAYRIDVEWWIYLLGGVGALVLAFVTISSQAVKASLVNPAESLVDE
ncbi:MAG: ABC transporter permease [Bacteroidota bacterium]